MRVHAFHESICIYCWEFRIYRTVDYFLPAKDFAPPIPSFWMLLTNINNSGNECFLNQSFIFRWTAGCNSQLPFITYIASQNHLRDSRLFRFSFLFPHKAPAVLNISLFALIWKFSFCPCSALRYQWNSSTKDWEVMWGS